MPSDSRQFFKRKLLPDVGKLLETHDELNPPGRGRRHLGHITRSGVLSLCSAWELYVEDVVLESAKFLIRDITTPDNLPDRVKGMIVKVAKADKHNFGVLTLCGTGWKTIYLDAVRTNCERLNTPKFGNVSSLMYDWLGVDIGSLEDAWRNPKAHLNDFVTLRGEIAHRGADAQYVRRDALSNSITLIDQFTIDTDNFLRSHLYECTNMVRRPWNTIPIR